MVEESDSADKSSFQAEATVGLLTEEMDVETASEARNRIESEFRSLTKGGGYATVTLPSGLEVTLGIEDMDDIAVFPVQEGE